MKINFEHLKAIQEQIKSKNSEQAKPEQDFEQLLQERLQNAKPDSTGLHPGASIESNAASLQANIQALQHAGAQTETNRAMENIEHILSKWEKYSQELDSGQVTPKQNYQTLQEILSTIESTKNDLAQGSLDSEELDSMLSELEIMAVTENIKFNRGDYF